MPLAPPQRFRKTEEIHRRGLSTDLPAANDVLPGTLYYSTDTFFVKRSSGTIWETYSGGGGDGTNTVVLSTVTGFQGAYTPGLTPFTLIEWSGGAPVTFGGLVGGIAGYQVTFWNFGTQVANFINIEGSSAVGTQFINQVSSSNTPVAPGGYISYTFDGTYWLITGYDQGAWILIPFAAGNFTASGAMTWTVAAGNVTDQSYRLSGTALTYSVNVSATTIGGVVDSELRITTPFTCAVTNSTPIQILSPGLASVISVGGPVNGLTYVRAFANLSGTNWAAGATAIVRGVWNFPVS